MQKFGTVCLGVALEYFTTALGDALTPEAGQAWAKFLDLMIEVATETAEGEISGITVSLLIFHCQRMNSIRKPNSLKKIKLGKQEKIFPGHRS